MDLWNVAVSGIVSTAEAEASGLGPAALRSLQRAGQLRRLIRGWYAVCPPAGAAPWDEPDKFVRARLMHALTTTALLRSFEGRVVASHYSALALHGVDLWRSDLGTVQLQRVRDKHSRHRRGAVLHPTLGADEPVEAPGGTVSVPLARAIVETGLLGAATRDPTIMAFDALVAADHALRLGLVSDDQIDAELHRHARHPGIVATRTLLQHRDGRHESVGETRTAHLHRVVGIHSTPQVEVKVDGTSFVVDFVDDDDPIATEFDGLVKYSQMGRTATDVILAEKRRETRIVDQTGLHFLRVVWSELDHPRAMAERYQQARALVRRRRRAA